MKATDRGKKLGRTQEDITAETHAPNLPRCVRVCTLTENCRSINYRKEFASKDEKNCQALAITKSNASVVLSDATGWIHYEHVSAVRS